jgi:hypothetical protein
MLLGITSWPLLDIVTTSIMFMPPKQFDDHNFKSKLTVSQDLLINISFFFHENLCEDKQLGAVERINPEHTPGACPERCRRIRPGSRMG